MYQKNPGITLQRVGNNNNNNNNDNNNNNNNNNNNDEQKCPVCSDVLMSFFSTGARMWVEDLISLDGMESDSHVLFEADITILLIS